MTSSKGSLRRRSLPWIYPGASACLQFIQNTAHVLHDAVHLIGILQRYLIPLVHSLISLHTHLAGITAQPFLGLLLYRLDLLTQLFSQRGEFMAHTREKFLLSGFHLAKAVTRLAGCLLKALGTLQQGGLQLRQGSGLALQLRRELGVLLASSFNTMTNRLKPLAQGISGLTQIRGQQPKLIRTAVHMLAALHCRFRDLLELVQQLLML